MVSVNGAQLHVERSGAGEPLVFVHGTGGGTFLFDRVTGLLPDYLCIRYDRRGNAKSALGGEEKGGIEGDADDLAALVEALGIAPCTLVGLSWGSAIVVDVLRRHPGICSSAVLGEPTIFALDPDGAQTIARIMQPRIAAALQSGGPRAAVDAFYSLVCGPFWETLSDDQREPYRDNARGLLRDLEAPPYDIREGDLGSITTRCALLVGDAALPFHRTVADVMRKSLPNVKYYEIPHSGHVVFGEQPEICANAVRRFLTDATS